MRRLSPAARRAAVPLRTGLAALLLALVTAPPAVAQPVSFRLDEMRAEVFSHLSRPVVAVGDTLSLVVDVLAAPTSEAALAVLVDAFGRAPAPAAESLVEAGASGVTMRRTGRVVELSRRFTLRAGRAGATAVPAVGIAPGLASRPHTVTAYTRSPAAASVGHVRVEGQARGEGFTRTGTAFLVAPGALVTAYHVVAGARRVTVQGPSGRPLRIRGVWALDPVRDVAVLAVDPADARAAGLSSLPLDAVPEVGLVTATVAGGLAAIARRYDDLHVDGERLFASANAVRPGDSGGPLLGASGAVLGVVVSGRTTAGEPDLLREDICLAADPRPTVAMARARIEAGERPTRLARALAQTQRFFPDARAMEAASALLVARRAAYRAGHADALAEAAAAEADRASLQFLAGSAFESIGDEHAAVGAFASAWNGGYVPAAYALAHHRLRAGDADAARDLFASVRAAAPYAHLGAFGVAQVAAASSRFAEAEEALAEVLDHDPRFGPALYLLGVVRLAQGRASEAHALAVRLGPTSEWTAALALMLRAPALRPEALRPLPPMAQAGR